MNKVGLDSSNHQHRETKVRERGLALIARFHRLFFFPQKKGKKNPGFKKKQKNSGHTHKPIYSIRFFFFFGEHSIRFPKHIASLVTI